MASKIYTAQELREAAVAPTYVGGVSEVRVKPEVYEMLEQAADMVERCEEALREKGKRDKQGRVSYCGACTCDVVNYILRGDAGRRRNDEGK